MCTQKSDSLLENCPLHSIAEKNILREVFLASMFSVAFFKKEIMFIRNKV